MKGNFSDSELESIRDKGNSACCRICLESESAGDAEHQKIQFLFAVVLGEPLQLFEEVEAVTFTGKAQDVMELINQKEIRWGVLEDSLEEKSEKELAAEAEKAEAESKDADAEENKVGC
ncbi:hypothetical protein R1sor_004681 [Riccia sorocarpa]|uniref:Uncharacterized protein n=1 Tax=Riccia sorocarpa TaxID=122646 RepID=A0ABD3HL59_9MARC